MSGSLKATEAERMVADGRGAEGWRDENLAALENSTADTRAAISSPLRVMRAMA